MSGLQVQLQSNSPIRLAAEFDCDAGELVALVGPSGSGKTSILRAMAGLWTPPDVQGRICVAGQDWLNTATGVQLTPQARRAGLVFQHYALFPHMTAEANVALAAGAGWSAADVQALLSRLGLAALAQRRPAQLSGGQQQRVALARALVLEPSVLLFDEPLSNLDARLRRSMRDEIRHLQQRLGLTVAYVTHDQSEALAVSDQIIVMEAGCIAQAGTPQDLYERPASAFVAGFMGEAVLFDGQSLADGMVQLGPLQLVPRHAVAPGAVRAAVRPEAWLVGRELSGGESLPGSLSAELQQCSYLGSFVELTFDTALGPVFVVSPEVERDWRIGQVLALSLPGRGVSVVAV